MAGDAVELREIDSVLVAGRSGPERVFEVLGRPGRLDAATRELRDRFAEGLAAYRGGSWDEARAAFTACLAVRPDDGPAAVFLERLYVIVIKGKINGRAFIERVIQLVRAGKVEDAIRLCTQSKAALCRNTAATSANSALDPPAMETRTRAPTDFSQARSFSTNA